MNILTNNFERIKNTIPQKMCKLIYIISISSLLFSCTNNLDKWYQIDRNIATLTYNDIEYKDFNYTKQHDINLPIVDSLSGKTKFLKSENKIYLGYKIRILLKGKYDMYQIKFGFQFLDKDGFSVSDFIENSYNLCPPNKVNSFQDKIKTKLSEHLSQKIKSVKVKLIINDVKSSKERHDQNKTIQK